MKPSDYRTLTLSTYNLYEDDQEIIASPDLGVRRLLLPRDVL